MIRTIKHWLVSFMMDESCVHKWLRHAYMCLQVILYDLFEEIMSRVLLKRDSKFILLTGCSVTSSFILPVLMNFYFTGDLQIIAGSITDSIKGWIWNNLLMPTNIFLSSPRACHLWKWKKPRNECGIDQWSIIREVMRHIWQG